ncbi:hypothetical protein ACA910_006815 [Epithemia clementina (nom. ined.)]
MVLFAKEKSSVQSVAASAAPSSKTSTHSKQQQRQQQRQAQHSHKKAKDASLRKSDRRQLLQRVLQVFSIPPTILGHDYAEDHIDTNNSGRQQPDDNHNNHYAHDNNDDVDNNTVSFCVRQLQHIFLTGTLVQRTLIVQPTQDAKKSDKKVLVYYRGPDCSEENDNNHTKTSSNKNDQSEPLLWPYQQLTQAVWIELDDKNVQLPTVALLSALSVTAIRSEELSSSSSLLLPTLVVFPNVSKYLCRGADLMKSGIAQIMIPSPRPSSEHNDDTKDSSKAIGSGHHDISRTINTNNSTGRVCAIQIEGNPQPMAVGLLTSEKMLTSAEPWGPGTQGVAAHIYTCYGDDLWRQQLPIVTTTKTSSKASTTADNPFDLGHYGNPGFLEGKLVVRLARATSAATVAPLNAEQEDEKETSESNEDHQTASTVNSQNEESEAIKEGALSGNGEQGNERQTTAPDEPPSPSPDDVLHQATCRALVQLHPKRDLPLNMAVFYSQHVLKQEGLVVQLKQTRYKKFGAYIKEQVDRELIEVGPDASKNDALAMLIGYDVRHADLIPYVQEKRQEQANIDQEIAQNERKRVVLADLYRIPQHFVQLLRLDPSAVQASNATSDERRGTGFLTVKEVRAVLDEYVQREELVDPRNQGRVVLDGPLTDALYKQKKSSSNENDQAEPPPMSLTRKDLVAAWQAKMESAYAMVEMPGNNVVKLGRGAPPMVTIEVSKRQSKKFSTRVRGMEQYGVNAQELRQQLAHRFACAVALEEDVSGLPKQCVELQLQGNLVDEVEALLVGDPSLTDHGGAKDSPYQLPPNAIEVLLRKGVPARKKRATKSTAPGSKKK